MHFSIMMSQVSFPKDFGPPLPFLQKRYEFTLHFIIHEIGMLIEKDLKPGGERG